MIIILFISITSSLLNLSLLFKFSMSSSSNSPRDYSRKYQRAILEPWRQSHGLPPSPPSPPNRTTPTPPISNNSLSYSSPLQNSTQNLNEIHHLSNMLDISLQQAIKDINPSPPTSTYIPPPSLDQVYKAKKNAKGEVEKYKARIVAKGYKQNHGIDYEEVYAPIARLETIRMVIAITAQYSMIDELKKSITRVFEMTYIGFMSYYLGIKVKQTNEEYSYVKKDTPMRYKEKPSKHDGGDEIESTLFKSLIRSLRYLTCIRTDILFGVRFIIRFIEEPTTKHWRLRRGSFIISKVPQIMVCFIQQAKTSSRLNIAIVTRLEQRRWNKYIRILILLR
ncbi:retrovirus-related pol polyprotein from transposon TNT 1-94 [Tanacetum coccineum]